MSDTPLKDQLTGSEPDRIAIDRLWRRVEEKRQPRRSRSAVLAFGGFATASVAALFFLLRPAQPLLTEQGEPVASAVLHPTREVALNDGSALQLSNAQMHVRGLDSKQIALDLDQGAVGVFVKPGGPRRWSFYVGDVRVDVVGTRFDILRSGSRVRVAVQKGLVSVSGERVPGGNRMLAAGEVFDTGEALPTAPAAPTQLQAPPPQDPLTTKPQKAMRPAASQEEAMRPAAQPQGAMRPAAQPEETEASPPAVKPSPSHKEEQVPPSVDWRDLARAGDFAAAAKALGDAGIEDAAAKATSADDLYAIADIATVAHKELLAIALMDRLIATAPLGQARAIAAYKKGILFFGQGDNRRAAESLEQALELGLPKSVRAQAEKRVIDAWIRAGEPERGRRWNKAQ